MAKSIHLPGHNFVNNRFAVSSRKEDGQDGSKAYGGHTHAIKNLL